MIKKLTINTGFSGIRGVTHPNQITNHTFRASTSKGDVGRRRFVTGNANIAHYFIHKIRSSIYTRV